MIYTVRGDLLKSDCTVIAHQCNCFGKMGAGIAKQIKKMYPSAYVADREYSVPVGDRQRLGKLSYTTVGSRTILISTGNIAMGEGSNRLITRR